MSKGIFKNYPIISYNNKLSRNLMVSSKIIDDIFNVPAAFFEYVVEDGESPEEIALDVYGSKFFSWVVLLSNKILDVHNEWPKDYQQFTRYIIQKYGSIPAAKSTVVHYKHPDYGFTINEDTYSRYANTDFLDSTSIDRTIGAGGWSPVDAFEYEEERNDNLRVIKLLEPSLIDQVQEEMESLFNG